MSAEKQDICRLCFNIVKSDYVGVNDTIKEILDVLLFNVNLDISESPIICQSCIYISEKLSYFKLTCIDTEKLLLLHYFATDKEYDKFELEDIYKSNKTTEAPNNKNLIIKEEINIEFDNIYEDTKNVEVITDEDFNICRFCKKKLGMNNFILLDVFIGNGIYKEVLPVIFPEMDMSIIKNPVICPSCRGDLQRYMHFFLNCMDVEEKISVYRNSESIDNTSRVHLNSIHFLFNKNNPGLHKESVDQRESPNASQVNTYKYTKTRYEDDISQVPVYRCEKCTYVTKRKFCLQQHSISHKDESEVEMHKCPTCTYKTKYKSNLNYHILQKHKDSSEATRYKCWKCQYKTKHKHRMNTHMSRIHKDAPEVETHKCPSCQYETNYKQNMKLHLLLKHKDASQVEMFKCEKCTFMTKRECNFQKHAITHKDSTQVEMYKCPTCTYETRHKRRMTNHTQLHHTDAPEIRKFKCAQCTYASKYKYMLDRHMVSHKSVSEVEMYKCTICSLETKYKTTLNKHILVHKDASEVQMFECMVCDFETKRKSNLMTHLIKHKDAVETEMYKCAMCSFETKYKNALKLHTKIHKLV